MLLPYLVWGILQYLIWQIVKYPEVDVAPLKHLFFINTDGLAVAGALWFLTALFAADIIYVIVRKYIDNQLTICFVVSIIAFFGNLENIILPFKLPFSLGAAFVGVGFMHIGWLCFHKEKGRQLIHMGIGRSVLLGAVITMLIFVNGNVNMRIGVYACVPLFWINAVCATLVGINISRFCEICFMKSIINELEYIGRNSIIYVCLNQLIIMLVVNFVNVLDFPRVLNKGIILLGTMFILKVMTHICMNTKVKFLFGKR